MQAEIRVRIAKPESYKWTAVNCQWHSLLKLYECLKCMASKQLNSLILREGKEI